jgi:hypothetical protein
MDYHKGDILSLTAVKMKNKTLAGQVYVKIVKYQGNLHFRPLLLKNITSIPIAAIDYFEPTWLMEDDGRSHSIIEARILERGIEHYEVLWTIISNAWNETRSALASAVIQKK